MRTLSIMFTHQNKKTPFIKFFFKKELKTPQNDCMVVFCNKDKFESLQNIGQADSEASFSSREEIIDFISEEFPETRIEKLCIEGNLSVLAGETKSELAEFFLSQLFQRANQIRIFSETPQCCREWNEYLKTNYPDLTNIIVGDRKSIDAENESIMNLSKMTLEPNSSHAENISDVPPSTLPNEDETPKLKS